MDRLERPSRLGAPNHDPPQRSAPEAPPPNSRAQARLLDLLSFVDELGTEIDTALELSVPNPYFRMATHLIRNHLEGKTVTASTLAAASGVPYATAMRKLKDLTEAGLIETRPRTRTGKSFSLHPSSELIHSWTRLCDRIESLAARRLAKTSEPGTTRDYYFGGSYLGARSIEMLRVLPEPLTLPGGIRILVHGDPTFMVMDSLKRQFEQVIGTSIHQRAFSIDRLREEALKNAKRPASLYDIIAVDLPWIGEFAEGGVLTPLDAIMDVGRLDPADFHTAGWSGAHWKGRAYGVPSQTTPELLFYRRDLFAEAGLAPPTTTDELLAAAEAVHDPRHGRYGIAWNAARGTALGHTFLMVCADFGQPIFDLPPIAGGFDTTALWDRPARPMFDSPGARAAAEHLLKLMRFSPPDILSMSWYERIRPYASGRVAMAYGYTLLAPYFELDEGSPSQRRTGYLPHPAGPGRLPVAPVGGYVLGIPANLPPERRDDAVEALIAFTSPEAQKLYIQNGSRTAPRYSVGADPDVRALSPIFEVVDGMSWRDELQFWPRPPAPQIDRIVKLCGVELHDMLRGIVTPETALARCQDAAEAIVRDNTD